MSRGLRMLQLVGLEKGVVYTVQQDGSLLPSQASRMVEKDPPPNSNIDTSEIATPLQENEFTSAENQELLLAESIQPISLNIELTERGSISGSSSSENENNVPRKKRAKKRYV